MKVRALTRHILTMTLHVDDYRSDSFQPEPTRANSLCLDESGKPQEASTQNQFAKDFNVKSPADYDESEFCRFAASHLEK